MEAYKDKKGNELIEAIRKGVSDTINIIDDISNGLMESARLLRIEQSERSFAFLSDGMNNLGHLVEFIKELKRGLEYLQGYDIPAEMFSCWDKSVGLFNELLSALEGKDWITVADLIEYELNPLLLTEVKVKFSELNDRLKQ